MALRKGKSGITVILKDETIKIIENISNKELTSRSAICAKIIEENIEKYLPQDDK
jgi:metal-responsive CopG/Arc/MetJ family transcriptional regulator